MQVYLFIYQQGLKARCGLDKKAWPSLSFVVEQVHEVKCSACQ